MKIWIMLCGTYWVRTAAENGVEVFLTGDGTLHCEQNLTGRRLALVTLSVIQLPNLRKYLPEIIEAIHKAQPGSFQLVDCGTFSRKK